jgi:hypothetical protein
MATKPQNELQEKQERAEKARRKHYAQKREKMLKERTGLSRKNHTPIIGGLRVRRFIDAVLVRERWIRVPYGRNYHFMLLRYVYEAEDGQTYSAMQLQCHDADHGWMLNVSRFYAISPLETPLL